MASKKTSEEKEEENVLQAIKNNSNKANEHGAEARQWKIRSLQFLQDFQKGSKECKENRNVCLSLQDVNLTYEDVEQITDTRVRKKVKAIVEFLNGRALKGGNWSDRDAPRREVDMTKKIGEREMEIRERYEEETHRLKVLHEEVVAKFKEDKHQMQEEMNEMSKTIWLINENNTGLQRELDIKIKEKNRYETQSQEQERKIEELTKELEVLKTPKDVSIVIPREIQKDRRMDAILEHLTQRLRTNDVTTNITMKPGRQISSTDGMILLPCILAANLDHSVKDALQNAQIDGYCGRVIVIVFHHLAQHRCRLSGPSRIRLKDQQLVENALLVADAVYWSGSMYDCEANTTLMCELQQLLKQ